jgi:hypothetical protein
MFCLQKSCGRVCRCSTVSIFQSQTTQKGLGLRRRYKASKQASKLANTKQSSSPIQSKLVTNEAMENGFSYLPSVLCSDVVLFHANNSSSKSFHFKNYYSAPPASRQLAGLLDSSEVEVSTLAGTSGSSGSTNGVGTNSQFNNPFGVAISADGTYALVAEYGNHLIRRMVCSHLKDREEERRRGTSKTEGKGGGSCCQIRSQENEGRS